MEQIINNGGTVAYTLLHGRDPTHLALAGSTCQVGRFQPNLLRISQPANLLSQPAKYHQPARLSRLNKILNATLKILEHSRKMFSGHHIVSIRDLTLIFIIFLYDLYKSIQFE